jgi:integrase
MGDRAERWAGGFVRRVGAGPTERSIFIIRRQVGGRRFEVSTRRGNLTGALLELARFEDSPLTYEATPEPDLLGGEGPQPIFLDSVISGPYLKACAKTDSPKYWKSKKKLIAWWLVQLAGKDLRRLDLSKDVLPHVPHGAPSRSPKIATLKHFFSWMADVEGGNLIDASENATLGLKVPQADPVQRTRPKTFSAKNLRRALARLRKMGKTDHADAVVVLAETGWHVTELDRLARKVAGTGIEALPSGRKAKRGSAVLLTLHKVGAAPHRTEVGPQIVAAAKRLIKRGSVPANLTPVLVEVNHALDIKADHWVMPGRARHSVATAAVNRGDSVQSVAEFLGHRSSATTRRFYSATATPKKVQGMLG